MMKKNSGISAVSLIFALVLLISLGAFFISLMLGKHIGAPLLAQSTKALYIADAGIERTAIYLRGFAGDPDWTDGITDIPSTPFGGGTFAVAFTNKTANSVTANSTGTIGNATRVISIRFTRQAVLMQNPVNWLSKIEIRDNVTVNGASCPECQDSGCLGNPCANQVTPADAPLPITPTGVTSQGGSVTGGCTLPAVWGNMNISGPGNCTFAAGTYYFNELEIDNGAVVTVNGPVTIWIADNFRLRGTGTQFNWGGNAADLLLLAAGASPDTSVPEFEIEDGLFKGAIYGPQPGVEIEVENNAQVIGTITVNEIDRLRDTTITSDPSASAGLNAMIDASGWGEM